MPGGLGEGDDKAYLGLSASMASAGNQGASMASAGNQGASTHESEPSFPRLSWLMEMVLSGASITSVAMQRLAYLAAPVKVKVCTYLNCQYVLGYGRFSDGQGQSPGGDNVVWL